MLKRSMNMKIKTISFAERGQALILIAISLVALFAIVGLAVDGSMVFSDRRHAQNAADTAAVAAALSKVNDVANGVANSTDCSGGSGSHSPANCGCASGQTPYSAVCSDLIVAGLNRVNSNG